MKQPFRNGGRDVPLLLVARSVAAAAELMLVVSLVLHVHDLGAGPWANAALMASMAVPAVLTMGVAGRVADTRDSRQVIAAARVVEVTAALALAVGGNLWWTCVWAAIFQVGYCFASPVWSALVPRIVGDERVQQVVGLQMLVSAVVGPLGGAGGALLVEWRGTRAAMLAVAGLVLVSGAAALAIRTRRGGPAVDDGGAPQGGGLALVRRDPLLFPVLIGTCAMLVVLQGVNVVEVFLARDELGASPAQYGLGEIAGAIGSLAAAGVVSRIASEHHRVAGVLLGWAGCAAAIVTLGLAPDFAWYLPLVVVLGLTTSVGNGALGPLFLLRTAEECRGRVMAALGGVTSAVAIVALGLGGAVGAWLGPRQTFVMGGSLALVVLGATAVAIDRAQRAD